MASLALKMSVSLDGYVASIDGNGDWKAAGRSADGARWVVEPVSTAAFSGGAVAHVFAARHAVR